MAADAMISLATAKRNAGAMGPSGSVSKNRSASIVVARAVAQRRPSAGAPGRSQGTMATTPERVCSCRHPGQSASPQWAHTTAAGTSLSTSSSLSTARTFAARSRAASPMGIWTPLARRPAPRSLTRVGDQCTIWPADEPRRTLMSSTRPPIAAASWLQMANPSPKKSAKPTARTDSAMVA